MDEVTNLKQDVDCESCFKTTNPLQVFSHGLLWSLQSALHEFLLSSLHTLSPHSSLWCGGQWAKPHSVTSCFLIHHFTFLALHQTSRNSFIRRNLFYLHFFQKNFFSFFYQCLCFPKLELFPFFVTKVLFWLSQWILITVKVEVLHSISFCGQEPYKLFFVKMTMISVMLFPK